MHAHTRAQTLATRQAPVATATRANHGACHCTPTSHTHPHIPWVRDAAHSHAASELQSHARPHDAQYSHNHSAVRQHHCTQPPLAPAHTPRTAELHTAPTEEHTQTHTRLPRLTHRRAVRLPSVDGMLPESLLMCNCNCLPETPATASHPTPLPTPASRSQRISAIAYYCTSSINDTPESNRVRTLRAIAQAQTPTAVQVTTPRRQYMRMQTSARHNNTAAFSPSQSRRPYKHIRTTTDE